MPAKVPAVAGIAGELLRAFGGAQLNPHRKFWA
jgi:hypothetical protein